MHACGHDAHAAMLLGAAYVLNEMKDEFNGKVKLIFQPSEENSADCGAKRMIADGALENPHVDAMIAQHVSGTSATGTVSSRPGPLTAASDRFFITIEGKACHASAPHNGVDALLVGAQVVTALQSIVARNVAPLKSAVLTIGKFNAGDRYNVLAGRCEMEGTCRNLNPEVRSAMPGRMENIIKGIAEGMGASYTFNYIMGYSSNINDHGMFALARETSTELLGKENVIIQEESGLGGEDFCFFAEKVPTIYFQTGCRREDVPVFPLHNGKMNLNEAGLKVAARVMLNTALNYLAQE
jgi:amidohydrolase